jgi:hypothetical protein
MRWAGLFAFSLLLSTLTQAAAGPPAPLVRVPVPPPRDERIVPLGPAEVRELAGEATMRAAQGAGVAPPQAKVQTGATLLPGAWLRTSSLPASRVELRFTDGSLLRLGPDTEVSIAAAQRQILLHRGRVLVVSDRMVGGVTVVTATRAFLPEGTTYLVESPPTAGGSGATTPAAARLSLRVLEGAVCACSVEGVTPTAPAGKPALRPQPKSAREQIVLPGETWTAAAAANVRPQVAAVSPMTFDLGSMLRSERLLTDFSTPLPTLARLNELADQQRRRLLAGRNARLRREIFWKRLPRAPLKLPALLAEPSSVTVTYE